MNFRFIVCQNKKKKKKSLTSYFTCECQASIVMEKHFGELCGLGKHTSKKVSPLLHDKSKTVRLCFFSAVLFSCSALYRCQSIESLRRAATFFSSQLQCLVFSEIDRVHLFSPKRSVQLCFVHKHRYFLYSTTSIHSHLIDYGSWTQLLQKSLLVSVRRND